MRRRSLIIIVALLVIALVAGGGLLTTLIPSAVIIADTSPPVSGTDGLFALEAAGGYQGQIGEQYNSAYFNFPSGSSTMQLSGIDFWMYKTDLAPSSLHLYIDGSPLEGVTQPYEMDVSTAGISTGSVGKFRIDTSGFPDWTITNARPGFITVLLWPNGGNMNTVFIAASAIPANTQVHQAATGVGKPTVLTNPLSGTKYYDIAMQIEASPVAGPVPALTAAFTSTVSSTNTLAVSFASTVSGGTPPYFYKWNFGDPSTIVGSGLASPSHTYLTGGTYVVTLIVTDSVLQSTTVSNPVTVSPGGTYKPQTVSFTANVHADQRTVDFFSTVTDGLTPYKYAWDFGVSGATSTAANPTYVYSADGTYTVKLTVTDAKPNSVSTTKSVGPLSALTNPPTAQFNCAVTNGSIACSGTASDGVPPYAYAWTFGDGGTATTLTVTHVYSVAGLYTVTFTVTDSKQLSAVATKQVTITESGCTVVTCPPPPPPPPPPPLPPGQVDQTLLIGGLAAGGVGLLGWGAARGGRRKLVFAAIGAIMLVVAALMLAGILVI